MKKLKKILGKLNPSKDAIFMGYALKWHQSVWMSGGAGYVVSSKAFQEMLNLLKDKEDEFLTLKVKVRTVPGRLNDFLAFYEAK